MRMKLLVVTVLTLGMIPLGCEQKKNQVAMPEPETVGGTIKPIPTTPGGTDTAKPPLVAPTGTVKSTEKVTPPVAPVAGKTYTVKKGDTFFSISREVYGSDKRAKDIQAANPTVDPSKMAVGTVLKLPPK